MMKPAYLLNLLMFQEKIKKLAKEHARFLFKPHPQERGKELIEPMKKLGAEIYEHNIYHILAQNEVSTVCGISSSCLYEAEYFDKKAIFFGDRKLDSYKAIDPSTFLSVNFWAAFLETVLETNHISKDVTIYDKPNRLRKNCYCWWGFDIVEKQ